MRRALEDWPVSFAPAPVARRGDADLSFVIGHKGEERLPHLERTLQTLFAQRGVSCEYIVVEQDENSKLGGRLPAGVRHLHIRPPDIAMPYSRSWSFNVGARAAEGRIFVFHDNDLCAPEAYGRELLRLHQLGYKAMRLQRFVFNLSETATAAFFRDEDVTPYSSLCSITQNVQGGTIAVDRESFFDIGGFDEAFVGWGGEDNEFFERCNTSHGYFYMYLPFVHLCHAPQPGKSDQRRETSEVFMRRSSISTHERIMELKTRNFGAVRQTDPPYRMLKPIRMIMEPSALSQIEIP